MRMNSAEHCHIFRFFSIFQHVTQCTRALSEEFLSDRAPSWPERTGH